MKYHKIVLAGGNGYLGHVLADYYQSKADEVIILSRTSAPAQGNIKTVLWDGKTAGDWAAELKGADMLINLCGKNVNCRYSAKNKAGIFASRLIPTALLGRAISELANPPKLWINITSATIYRHAEDLPQDEATGEIGEGFSVDVCKQWEAAFDQAKTTSTRKITLRMGMVLGRADSVFPRLLNLVKFGLGGKQGSGQQYVSWIHETDVARSIEFLQDHAELDGIFNCVAPVPVKNVVMMQSIRIAYGRAIGLNTPVWLLKIGAFLIGTEPELVLKSRMVVPGRLLDHGFQFRFKEIGDAVDGLMNE